MSRIKGDGGGGGSYLFFFTIKFNNPVDFQHTRHNTLVPALFFSDKFNYLL